MTPAEHLAAAEALMSSVTSPLIGQTEALSQAMTAAALTHAVIALAIELGVPQTPATQKGA